MAEFNLSTIYRTAFAVPYTGLPQAVDTNQADAFSNLQVSDVHPEATGVLGVPIHMPVELDGYRLPNEPLVTISLQKRIVTTEIDGQDGSFKELYSLGDYDVTIQGIAIDDNEPDDYPEDIMRKLRTIIEKRQHISVKSRLTGLFNIEHLAIVAANFPAQPGDFSMPAYELRCLSDRDFPLKLRTR